MQQVITTFQLAEEANRILRGTARNPIYLELLAPTGRAKHKYLVDLVTAIDNNEIRIDFWIREGMPPLYAQYGSGDWVQIAQQIPAFAFLRELNIKLLRYSHMPAEDPGNNQLCSDIVHAQAELLTMGFETILHVTDTDDVYATIQRRKENVK